MSLSRITVSELLLAYTKLFNISPCTARVLLQITFSNDASTVNLLLRPAVHSAWQIARIVVSDFWLISLDAVDSIHDSRSFIATRTRLCK